MTNREELRAQTAQMQQATPLMQRQQREAEKEKEDEKARKKKLDREKKKPLPNLADAVQEDGARDDPNEANKKLTNEIRQSNESVEESIESGNKRSNQISEENVEETKKTNSLLKRIIKVSGDSIKEGALKAGETGLENSKEVAKGSFGEFGILAQNLIKTAYTAIKKVSEEEDEEESRKGKKKKKKVVERIESQDEEIPIEQSSTNESIPSTGTEPKVERVNNESSDIPPKIERVDKEDKKTNPPIIPPVDPIPIHETVQPSKVWSKRPENKTNIQSEQIETSQQPKLDNSIGKTSYSVSKKPIIPPVDPIPIHETVQPSKVWSKRPDAPLIERMPPEAPKEPTAASKIDRNGKSPQQVRIERMHRREGITASVESKDKPKLERMNRTQIKQQKLEEKKAEKENPPKELVEMNDSLEKLVKLSEDQLKQSQSEELSKNSNELQAAKPDKDKIDEKVDAPKDDKKKGFLSGMLGSLFEGLIGSVSSGKGLMGIVGGAISTVLGSVKKIVKPIGGFISGLAKSGKLIPVIGQIVAVVSGIFDFFDGWKNAADILGKDGKLLTVWDKFSAAIGSVLGGFVSIIDDVLGFFGIETKFGETIKKGVAGFLADLPAKIGSMFDSLVKGVDDLTGGFASKYLTALKSFWTSALKGLLSNIPGGGKISSFLGLDNPEKSPSKAPEVVAVPKSSSTFAPRAEANASVIKADDRNKTQPTGTTVVAPSSNTQVVNNNNYSSGPLTTRNTGDSHRYSV